MVHQVAPHPRHRQVTLPQEILAAAEDYRNRAVWLRAIRSAEEHGFPTAADKKVAEREERAARLRLRHLVMGAFRETILNSH